MSDATHVEKVISAVKMNASYRIQSSKSPNIKLHGEILVDEIERLRREIEHLRAPSAEPELRAEVERLRSALVQARGFVAAQLDVELDSYCLKGADGNPDISTLDETDGGVVGEAVQALERIDAALGGGAVGS